MEKNSANSIDYFLAIDDVDKEHLAAIRHWSNVKVATEGTAIWVRNIDFAQLNSLEIKSMPHKKLFYERDGKLFPVNRHLPDRNVPSLLWTPIERAVPVNLPSFNHNFFGINERISIQLILSQVERQAVAMIVGLSVLQHYVESAPAVRLKPMSWAVLNNDKAFLVGTPLLPINGPVFWNRGDALIPAGYDFEFYALSELITRQLSPENDSWVVWNTDATYFLVGKDDLQPLSRGSLRASIPHFVS